MLADTGQQQAQDTPYNHSKSKHLKYLLQALRLNRHVRLVRLHQTLQIELLALRFSTSILQRRHGGSQLLVGKLRVQLKSSVGSGLVR